VIAVFNSGQTQAAISRALGMERKTIRRWLRRGEFPERKPPNLRLTESHCNESRQRRSYQNGFSYEDVGSLLESTGGSLPESTEAACRYTTEDELRSGLKRSWWTKVAATGAAVMFATLIAISLDMTCSRYARCVWRDCRLATDISTTGYAKEELLNPFRMSGVALPAKDRRQGSALLFWSSRSKGNGA
jgi:hypothetical protein